MNKYEMMFIVKATMESDAVKATAENMKKVVTDCGGKVEEFKGGLGEPGHEGIKASAEERRKGGRLRQHEGPDGRGL